MTGREREDGLVGVGEVARRDGPFDAIWGQVTSQWGDLFSPATTSTSPADSADVFTAPQATPSKAVSSPTGNIMTTDTAIPISTVTVAETSLRTTFVTVPLTTNLTPSYAPVSHTEKETKMTACTSRSATAWPSPQISESSSRTQGIPLPTFATGSPPSGTSSTIPIANTRESASAPSSTPAAGATAASTTQKHAIIGGLSGSIAGVLFIGIIACLLWRRRKPRFVEDDDDYDSKLEKGLRPMIARKWSELKARSPKPPPPVAAVAPYRTSNRTSRSFSPSTSTNPQDDSPVLRVSLDNWARPYAHDVGYRESQGPTTLRVMNPDLSRPNTPPVRPGMETAGSFLKRQRNALAAALYGGKNVASPSPLHPKAQTGNAEAGASNELLAPKALAPSVRSGSSGASGPVVVQQPPEDPFLTPPDERAEVFGVMGGNSNPTTPAHEYETNLAPVGPPRTSPARPGISPLQNDSSHSRSATRTLSSTLHLFPLRRNRSNASSDSNAAPSSSLGLSRSGSRRSTQTFSSAGHPFMLDRGTPRVWRGGRDGGGAWNGVGMYEGT